MRIQLIIEDEVGQTTTAEIAGIERRQSDDLIGLSLEEAKAMTGGVQRAMVEAQVRAAINRGSTCPKCQSKLRRNGSHRVRYRTPFGRLDLSNLSRTLLGQAPKYHATMNPNSAALCESACQKLSARLRGTAISNTGVPSGASSSRHRVTPIWDATVDAR